MTDRLKRETELPAGYQFGDARWPELAFDRRAFEIAMRPLDRVPCEVIYGVGYFRKDWNDIERGEH